MPRRAACRARAATQTPETETEEYVEEDFYALLGVSPWSDAKEIKRAYYSLMRACHPDRMGGGEANDFCALLNDVYETLMDPTRRALYDELAGFSAEAVNPFLDDRHPLDRVFVDEFACIGCRNCNAVCPKTFDMEEDFGRARVMAQDADAEEKLQEAIDTCPVSCIHWVSGPQLSQLEAAMARMERVAVWSMMGGMGANKDVFVEASTAWTKRQADIRRRVEEATAAAAPGPAPGWGLWDDIVSTQGATGSRMYREADEARRRQREARQQAAAGAAGASAGGGGAGGPEGGVSDGREGKRVAALAARAARAARTWRAWQALAGAARRSRLSLSLSSVSSLSSMDGSGSDGA